MGAMPPGFGLAEFALTFNLLVLQRAVYYVGGSCSTSRVS